jgi:hypothetical protein
MVLKLHLNIIVMKLMLGRLQKRRLTFIRLRRSLIDMLERLELAATAQFMLYAAPNMGRLWRSRGR